MKKKLSKRHHIVPRFMLNEFASSDGNNKLWAINVVKFHNIKLEGKKVDNILESGIIYPISVNDATVISNFYSNPNEDDPVIEEKRISKIESDAAPIYKEILRTCKMPIGEKRELFLTFIANLYNRTEWSRRNLKLLIKDLADNTGNPKSDWHEIVRSRIFDETGNNQNSVGANKFLEYSSSDFGDIEISEVEDDITLFKLMELNWQIEVAPEGSKFICSDAPVFCWTNPGSVEFGFDENCFALCPLSQKLLLIGYMDETKFPCLGVSKIEKEFMTGYVNGLTCNYAEKCILGSERLPKFLFSESVEKIGARHFHVENFSEGELIESSKSLKFVPSKYPTMGTILKRRNDVDDIHPLIPIEVMKQMFFSS